MSVICAALCRTLARVRLGGAMTDPSFALTFVAVQRKMHQRFEGWQAAGPCVVSYFLLVWMCLTKGAR